MPCFSVFHRTRRKEKFKLSEAGHEPPLLVLGAEPQELSLGGFLANLHGAGEECPRNLGYDDDINRSTEWRGGYLIPGALHTEEKWQARAGQRTRANGLQKGAGGVTRGMSNSEIKVRRFFKLLASKDGTKNAPMVALHQTDSLEKENVNSGSRDVVG